MSPSPKDSPNASRSRLPHLYPNAPLSASPSVRVPDRVGFIPERGWRTWLVGEDGTLVSPLQRHVWPARERASAICLKLNPVYSPDPAHFEPAPLLDCACGIYAWKDSQLPILQFALAASDISSYCPAGWEPAVGQVSLWGQLMEHEDGWRAEYAYPYAVRVVTEERAKLVRNLYGVDVEVQP